MFIYAMKAPMTRNRYQTRVAKFFDFTGIPGTTLEEKASSTCIGYILIVGFSVKMVFLFALSKRKSLGPFV